MEDHLSSYFLLAILCWTGIEHVPPAVEGWSVNHCTTREVAWKAVLDLASFRGQNVCLRRLVVPKTFSVTIHYTINFCYCLVRMRETQRLTRVCLVNVILGVFTGTKGSVVNFVGDRQQRNPVEEVTFELGFEE